MKRTYLAAAIPLFASLPALAALPMGLKCDPSIKIVGAEIGQVGTYQVQKGMQKETHSALINRKTIAAVDTCSFEQDLVPGRVVTVRYTGPEVNETQVQCVDLANNNAPVVFPKSMFTVRVPNVAPYMLMPYCPDGNTSDGFACSKLDSQSQRGSEYRDTVMKWKANDPKTKQYKVDLQFDPAYVAKVPPYAPSVPYGAKLFCAAVNKKGEVVMAGTAQYPAASSAAPADTNFYQDKAARGSGSASPSRGGAGGAAPAEISKETAKESAKEAVKEAATGASSPAASALEAFGRFRKP